ncbi:hypothetical protein VTK56DRAFT_2236 [Thermocarpiscus australiensis]
MVPYTPCGPLSRRETVDGGDGGEGRGRCGEGKGLGMEPRLEGGTCGPGDAGLSRSDVGTWRSLPALGFPRLLSSCTGVRGSSWPGTLQNCGSICFVCGLAERRVPQYYFHLVATLQFPGLEASDCPLRRFRINDTSDHGRHCVVVNNDRWAALNRGCNAFEQDGPRVEFSSHLG